MGIFTPPNRRLSPLLLTGLLLPAALFAANPVAPEQAARQAALQAAKLWLQDQAKAGGWRHAEFALQLLPLRHVLPACHSQPQARVSPDSQPARIYVNVQCEGFSQRYLLRADIVLDLPVAARDIPAGQPLSEADVRWARIATNQPERLQSDSRQLAGMSSRQPIAAGKPFPLRLLEQPLLISRGMKVEIRAEQAGIEVKMNGIAQQAGRLGEWIEVRNVASGKVIRAEVMAAGFVRPQISRQQAEGEEQALPSAQ